MKDVWEKRKSCATTEIHSWELIAHTHTQSMKMMKTKLSGAAAAKERENKGRGATKKKYTGCWSSSFAENIAFDQSEKRKLNLIN